MKSRGNGRPTSLRRLRPSRNLTDRAAAGIAAEIRDGRLLPGSRLPTEQELMVTLGVSRTVVREAVSALRAEGLVVTRQGSGAFVAEDTSRVPFRIDPDALGSIADVLNVMELRLAIEVEAAALASERATAMQIGAIMRAHAAIDVAISRGDVAVSEDFLFHRAIAIATANAQFAQFLEFLGRHVIPRQRVRAAIARPKEQREYLTRIQAEHLRIAEAIAARDSVEARRAMRAHLTNSLKRYRRVAERSARAP
jgi:GntR family transcriptional regulator, transcriptional repressor for pyruvate dehydrogenase complex